MKKLFLLLVSLIAILPLAFAQLPKFNIYKGGVVVQSYPVSEVDSLTVGYALAAPTVVNAQLNNKTIVVSWTAVSGATSYQVYRSSDDKTYSLLKAGITRTNYTDASPLTGPNYYKVKAIGQGLESVLSKASAPISYNDDNGLEKGLYMGVIGFNDDLIDKGDMSLLAPNTKSSFTSFVNSLTTKKNTVLYYAVDKALDKLTSTPLPNNLRNVSIVTFTDGLDQGSLPMINYDPYVSKAEYRAYLDTRIKSTAVQGVSLSAYTIGIRGGDVTNVEEFHNNLVSLASPEENAMEVTNMSDVNNRFQKIAEQLTDITQTQTISIKFPMLDDGQVYRFTFDNVSNANSSKCYIEGTLNVRNNTLNNVRYVGLTCSSGTSIQGTRYGINISFDFVDLKDANGNKLSLTYVNEYYQDGSYWQVNSEFDKDDDIEVTVERSSAAIMLVLDCSSSLLSGSDRFTEMKTHAKAFIETLAAAMDDANQGGGTDPDPQPGGAQTYTVNGVSFKMTPVAGGTFQMGSTTGDSDEEPVHQVTLSNFSIGETEVTQELWQAVMVTNPSNFKGNKLPVERVSWNDCQTFITKLNQLTGKTFRLPTEAEWEYAARGGNKSNGYTYSGSNTIGDVAWYTSNSSSTTHAVATKAPNELGIYDMSGNVEEWCQDWYGSYSSGSQTNPTGPTTGSYRVIRGGSWSSYAAFCRVAYRDSYAPSDTSNNLGLRLAQ